MNRSVQEQIGTTLKSKVKQLGQNMVAIEPLSTEELNLIKEQVSPKKHR